VGLLLGAGVGERVGVTLGAGVGVGVLADVRWPVTVISRM
jgi:hypothetical protein